MTNEDPAQRAMEAIQEALGISGDPEEREANFRAIGHFVAQFSFLEAMLRMCLSNEVKLDPKYFDSVITHDFALLCTAFEKVYSETLDRRWHPRLKRWISKCREINDLRVKTVHGFWGDDASRLHHVSRQNLKSKEFGSMRDRLEDAAEEISELILEGQTVLYARRGRKNAAMREWLSKNPTAPLSEFWQEQD